MMESVQRLAQIVDDLSSILQRNADSMPLNKQGEQSPFTLEFLYNPPAGEDHSKNRSPGKARQDGADARITDSRHTGKVSPGREIYGGQLDDSGKDSPHHSPRGSVPENERKESPPNQAQAPGTDVPSHMGEEDGLSAKRKSMPDNVRCTLCEDRAFPIRKFKMSGRYPILVLHYTGSIEGSEIKQDRSNRLLFGSPEEDDLFFRMLSAAGFSADDFYFQQFPACFFNPADSMPEDWNRRCENCLSHVRNTIEQNNINTIIAVGHAAVFLFSEEMATDLSQSGEMIPLHNQGFPVHAMAMRSPLALLTIEQKRKAFKNRTDDASRKKYRELVEKEKSIKNMVLRSLQKLRSTLDT